MGQIIEKVSKWAERILHFVISIAAIALMIYAGYAIWDAYYTQKNAFISEDLLQYKPIIVSEDGTVTITTQDTFGQLQQINEDVKAWLTIYGTNIDYPVLQGRDDLQYASEDVFGMASLTGAIYMSAGNTSDFSDYYNIIYGHHMENGAMFGDIDKYEEENYFNSHRTGILYTPGQIYDVDIYALVRTNAYNDIIYGVADKDAEDYDGLRKFVEDNYLVGTSLPLSENSRLVAFSTCSSVDTNGRLVLFASLTPSESVISPASQTTDEVSANTSASAQDDPVLRRYAKGHGIKYWALLNLICVVSTLYIMLPLSRLTKKYSQPKTSRWMINRIDEAEVPSRLLYLMTQDGDLERPQKIVKALKKFIKRMRVGVVFQILLVLLSIVVFILTENLRNPITLIDRWTPLMILILTVTGIVDDYCFVYRGEDIPEVLEDEKLSE